MKDQVLKFASEELVTYLENAGYTIDTKDIKFGVRENLKQYHLSEPEDSFSDDQFYIDIQQSDGVERKLYGEILGTNSRSVLIGVYDYLYHLGFRFLRPGKEYDYIPERILSKEFTYRKVTAADHRHRGVCIEGADSLQNVLDFVDWLPKVGYNSFFIQFQYPYAFLEKWYHHRYNTTLEEEDFDMEKAKEYSGAIDQEILKRGLLHHRVGHGWTSETLGLPALGWDVDEVTLEEERLDYPAMLNGKRDLFRGVAINTNLCYSNEKIQEEMSDKIIDYAKKHPEVDYLHVWLADEYNNICECNKCSQEQPTDQYIRILNKADEKLESEGLDTKIVFLLYQELLWAPSKGLFHNPKRFVLMFAPISRTFETAYPEAGKTIPLPKYKRNNIELPTNLEENLGSLESWKKVFRGDSFVYDYPLGRAHYGDPSYVAISKIISKDIKHLKTMGLNGYISCQELRSALPNALPNYVMGRLLFQDNLIFEEIQEDYYQHAYGSSWEFVKDYLNLLGGYYSCDYYNGKGNRVDEKIQQKMEEALRFLDKSKCDLEIQENASYGIHKIFWEHLLYHHRYCVLLTNAIKALSQGEDADASNYWQQFRSLICNNEKEFQKCLDVYRITEVATRYTGFKHEI